MQTNQAIETNKALAVRFLHDISEGNLEALCALVSPGWRMHIGLGENRLPQGPEGLRKLVGSFGPIEQHWQVEDVIAEGEKVVVRATNRCRQESFLGVPAAGKEQRFTATFVHRIQKGVITETWRNADDLGRVLQLGAKITVPEPTQ